MKKTITVLAMALMGMFGVSNNVCAQDTGEVTPDLGKEITEETLWVFGTTDYVRMLTENVIPATIIKGGLYASGDVMANEVKELDGLYLRGASGTNHDITAKESKKFGKFSDYPTYTSLTTKGVADDRGIYFTLAAQMEGNGNIMNDLASKYRPAGPFTNGKIDRAIAFNAGVPGTCYALVAPRQATAEREMWLIFSEAPAEGQGDGDMKSEIVDGASMAANENAELEALNPVTNPRELKYTSTKPGAFWIAASARFNVYAVYFVPTKSGDSDGIAELKNSKTLDGAIFNLAGQRTNKPVKGLYIQNGKKYLVK